MKASAPPGFSVSLKAAGMQPEVLVIEDNDLITQIYKAIFHELGCCVMSARTIADAQTLLTQERPDLIIMDLRLPDGSGIDATRAIRGQPDLKNIPVIVITDGSPSSEEEARSAGCSACISKPINVGMFIELVRQYVDARSKTMPAVSIWPGAISTPVARAPSRAAYTDH